MGHIARAIAKKTVRILGRVLLGVFALFILILGLRATLRGTLVRAGTDIAHPAVCLGGWDNAALAAAEPTLPPDAQFAQFSTDNSAYLDPSVVAPLYCAQFDVTPRDQPPYKVSVSFNWAFAPAPAAEAAPAEATDTPDTSLSGTTFDASSTSGGTDIVIPALSAPADAAPADAPPADTPPADAPPATDAPQSFIYKSFLSLTGAAVARAQSPGIVSISYTYDGIDWIDGGTAGDDWQSFILPLPDATWDNLKNLQVRIEPLPVVNARPAVYIDAVSLHVQDDPSFIESVGDNLSTAGGLLSSALGAINNTADAALALLSLTDTPAPAPPSQPQPQAPAPPPVLKVSKLAFSRGGAALPAEKALPWFSDELQGALSRAPLISAPSLDLSDDGLSLVVSGACNTKYFVVLTFRSAGDYKDHPQQFASNYAGLCEGGTFSYDLATLPLDTPDGTYYLLVAGQNDTGPWIPSSMLVPVDISHREVTEQ